MGSKTKLNDTLSVSDSKHAKNKSSDSIEDKYSNINETSPCKKLKKKSKEDKEIKEHVDKLFQESEKLLEDSVHCKTKKKKNKKHKDIEGQNVVYTINTGDNITGVEPSTESEIKSRKLKKRKHSESTDNIVADTEGDTVTNGSLSDEPKIKKKKRKSESSCSHNDVDNESEQQPPITSSTLEDIPVGGLDIQYPFDDDADDEQNAKDATPFTSLRSSLSKSVMKAVKRLGFETMTAIQGRAIPPLLEGSDLRGTAKTGSGKTLAFLIPALQLLHKKKFTPEMGTGVLVLSPTRELAMQTHTVVQQLLQHYSKGPLTHALITGGTHRAHEAATLSSGASVVVATPGRLLDHLHNTDGFRTDQLACLVLDEADKMLDSHFQEVMKQILALLPKERQTMLFSATKSNKVEEIAELFLGEDFIDIDVVAHSYSVTSSKLQQSYTICPDDKKLLFLYQFLKRESRQKSLKCMVFFSTCDAVKYFHALLCAVRLPVLCIHGKMEQWERTKSFEQFNSGSGGALLCTDVAARGWDIHRVDWVVQYDPPLDTSEYIHRVGRTARGSEAGKAVLLLRRQEEAFVDLLNDRRCHLSYTPPNKALLTDKLQHKLESVVAGCDYLRWWAKQAFKSHLNSYYLRKRKDIFNIYEMDLLKLSKCLGLPEPPSVDLAFEYKKSAEKKIQKRMKDGFYDRY